MNKKNQTEWQVEWVEVSTLTPYENNPRDIEAAIPLVAGVVGARANLRIGA